MILLLKILAVWIKFKRTAIFFIQDKSDEELNVLNAKLFDLRRANAVNNVAEISETFERGVVEMELEFKE